MKIKLPSYEYLVRGIYSAVKRFPFALLSAILGTAVLVSLIVTNKIPEHNILLKLAMACALGLPLFMALATLAEKKESKNRILFQAAAFIPVILYYLSLPPDPLSQHTYLIRFLLLIVAAHLMVAFLPYLGGGQINGFWQYNKSYFLRFLISALYSAVMYIGLVIALLAARELFGLKVPDHRFFQLWVIIAATFNTWIFLAGVPQNYAELETARAYPNGLKIFIQYILLPLVGLYLVILYAYELKILITWNWPKGWVSQLVLWFSVVGILSMLLLWPLREENRWIRISSKWFFRALIPLIIMLFLAILERVGVYGITINRYLVLSMATCLTILTIYFVFSRGKDIRAIPITACMVALLAAYGPWSAFAVSMHSQQSRLERLMIDNKVLADGVISPKKVDVPINAAREMSGIASYLTDWHGAIAFSRWIPDSTIKAFATVGGFALRDTICKALGFEYTGEWQNGRGSFRYSMANDVVCPITGYEQMIRYSVFPPQRGSESPSKFVIGTDTCAISFRFKPPILDIRILPSATERGDSASIAMTDSLAVLVSPDNSIKAGQLTFDAPIGNYEVRVFVREVSGISEHDTTNVDNFNSYILLKKK